MKQVLLILVVLLQGCLASAPAKLYEHPERYRCQLILETQWDSSYPIKTFHHVLELDTIYHDTWYGTSYKLVATDDPNRFALQVVID